MNTIHPSQVPLATRTLADSLGIDRSWSELATIDRDRLERLARQIERRPDFTAFVPATWDDPRFWNSDDDAAARSQFYALGNTINFRFWRLDGGRVVPSVGEVDGETHRGAMYMWRCLRRALERNALPLLDAGFLAQMSVEEFDSVFTDDRGAQPLSVARDERLANIRDLGRRLSSSWDGAFLNVVQASNYSLVEFARLAARFRAFDDPLRKLTMVNAIMHSGSGVYRFADEPLPAIDYHLLRHTLRQGLVRPTPRLTRKLRASVPLDPVEALELRRVALNALVDLADRTGVSGEIVDNKFWLNRVNCTDVAPVCTDPATAGRCPFLDACEQLIDYALPLELGRYY